MLITSTGPAAESCGDHLGLYARHGRYNGRVCYKQLHTVGGDMERFLYCNADRVWCIGALLGDRGPVMNFSKAATVPAKGWTSVALDGCSRCPDPGLRLTPVEDISSLLCSAVTITAEGEAARLVNALKLEGKVRVCDRKFH